MMNDSEKMLYVLVAWIFICSICLAVVMIFATWSSIRHGLYLKKYYFTEWSKLIGLNKSVLSRLNPFDFKKYDQLSVSVGDDKYFVLKNKLYFWKKLSIYIYLIIFVSILFIFFYSKITGILH